MTKTTATLLGLVTLLLFQLPAGFTQEFTRYVVDQVVITVRDQPLDEANVIERLTTGDRVVLTGQSNEPFVEIRLADGRRGWVDSRYLTPIPIARVELERSLAETRAAQASAEESLIRLSDDYRLLNEELQLLRGSAGQPNELEDELERLKSQLALTQTEADDLRRRNKQLEEETDWRWFLIGSGVLLAGLVLGLIIPRRRRSPW